MSRTYRGRAVAVAAAAALAVVCGATALAEPTAAPTEGPSSLPAMVEWHTTSSGVKYAEITVGKGAPPSDGQTVIVQFTGWLDNGKQFSTTRGHDKAFGFPLGSGQVIRGWDEGIRGMRVGGTRRLIIPSSLGYGSKGVPGLVPPDATLTFDIELVHITDK